MASHVVVVGPGARRINIKVTPGTFMSDIFNEACTKFKMNAKNNGLKRNGKPVDLSGPFRLSGLPAGATLEFSAVSRTPTAISTKLQLPEGLAPGIPGGGMVDKLASDLTLWRILRHFESKQGQNLNFTARGVTEIENGGSGAGRIYYEMPVLQVMNRELSTFEDLQKTLGQLGLTGGSCLIKLTFRKTNQPLEEAMQRIGEYFKEEESPEQSEASAAAPPTNQADPITNAIANLPSPEPAVTEVPSAHVGEPGVDGSSYQEDVEQITVQGRKLQVFSAPSGNTPQAALQPHNEDDFEPTIAHAKLHQSRLQQSTQNKRLLSDAEAEQAEKEKAAKLAATREVSVRVRFPDQTSVQYTFTSAESCAELYTVVTSAIVAEDQPFKLVHYTKGPQTVPKSTSRLLIRDEGFGGRVLVNFIWEDNANSKVKGQPVLKPHLREAAQAVKVPEVAGVESKAEDGPSTVDKGKGKETSGGGGKGGKGMPKWFKGLGKK